MPQICPKCLKKAWRLEGDNEGIKPVVIERDILGTIGTLHVVNWIGLKYATENKEGAKPLKAK
jgi:hypothetical protein